MQLKQLLNLQDMDNHISRIKTELSDIPRQLELHQSKLNQVQTEEKNLHQSLEKVTKDRHAKELDLKEKEEEIKKLGTQLYAVKTNEQYKAIQNEMAGIKSKISELEDEILNAMEKIDQSKENLNRQKTIVQEEQKQYQAIEQKFSTEKERLESLLKEAEEKHHLLIGQIDPDLLKIYNRISIKWSGTALVMVKGDVCQGCYMTLPPQVVSEVYKNERIIRCENCSRILYSNENETVL